MKIITPCLEINIKITELWNSYCTPYPADCQKIREICADHCVSINGAEADFIWTQISNSEYSCGWIDVFSISDDQIWNAITHWMNEEICREQPIGELEQ